jgi:hypothetical protein
MKNNKRPRIIAVDFDGCLVTDEWPGIGEPVRGVIDALKAEREKGAAVILWTCRRGRELADAVKWCADRGIGLDAVNENLPGVTEIYGEDTRKIFADMYIDDRAINSKDFGDGNGNI